MTTHDAESDRLPGGPPIVLVAALSAALLIAVGLVAAFSSFGGGDENEPVPERHVGAPMATADKRVLLTVSVGGSGSGRVQIAPSDVACNRSCEYKFTSGARVTATAEPAPGSTFEGWDDICSGDARCTFVIDQPRSLSATFTEEPVEEPLCEEGVPAEEQDPACLPGDPDPSAGAREPGPNCFDNIDNDDDGLTDIAQDPDCEAGGSEGGSAPSSSSGAPPPPPAALPNQCTDGKDNDKDGLTDRDQDPDCETGRSETG